MVTYIEKGYTTCFIYYRQSILQNMQPSQCRCIQLQYRFAVISEAPSSNSEHVAHAWKNRAFLRELFYLWPLSIKKCHKQIKIQGILLTCATNPELPSNISTMVFFLFFKHILFEPWGKGKYNIVFYLWVRAGPLRKKNFFWSSEKIHLKALVAGPLKLLCGFPYKKKEKKRKLTLRQLRCHKNKTNSQILLLNQR